MAKKHTVGSFLFDYILSKGVKHAFGIPGDFALPTFRWLEQSPIETITMTHEPSVGFAADAYARVNGLGLAIVTYCVGGLNMLNSVACAYAEKSPIIVVSGGPSPSERHKDALIHHKVKTFDSQRRIYEEVTCANTILLDPETAAAEIMRVVDTVLAECRPGYIEVPYDIVDMPIKVPAPKPHATKSTDRATLAAAIADATSFINNAKRPVIVAGVELHRHKLTDKAIALAEKFNLPIAADLLSKSVLPETHPNYLGVFSGNLSDPKCKTYVDESDCLILLGTFITDVFMGFTRNQLNREQSILATSEETRIAYRSYDEVQLEAFMDALLAAPIQKRDFKNPNPAVKVQPLTDAENKSELTVPLFFQTLELNLPEGSTLACDVGDALIGAIGIRTHKHHNFIADAYYLSMGFAVPAAIGAMAGKPKSERVFAIVGDGAFQMTGTELSTAAKFGMAPIVLVMNNDGYGTQRHIIDGPFNEIHRWQYHKLPEMLGTGIGRRVTTPAELDAALKEALATQTLFLIEAIIPRNSSSEQLIRLGEGLSAQRDSTKRTAA